MYNCTTDLDDYIKMNANEVATKPRIGEGFFVNHVIFKVLYSIDNSDNKIIPNFFREHKFIELIEHSINTGVTHKNNIFYHLSYKNGIKFLQLNTIVYKQLSLVELHKLSMFLPASDILEYVKFKVSDVYTTVDRPDRVCYDLYCEVFWVGK
jgi:hypothetical protein